MLYGGYEYLQQIFQPQILQIAQSVPNRQTRAQKKPGQKTRPMGNYLCLEGAHIYVVRRDIWLQETRIQFHIPLELIQDALR